MRDVLDHREPQIRRHILHEAPIENAQAAIRGAQQIARVGVAWIILRHCIE